MFMQNCLVFRFKPAMPYSPLEMVVKSVKEFNFSILQSLSLSLSLSLSIGQSNKALYDLVVMTRKLPNITTLGS